MKQNLKRNIAMTFRVSPEEREQIMQRMDEIGVTSVRAYLLKMALSGHIITIDLTTVNECSRLLRNISGNINQIAKRANETGRVYGHDITKIQNRQEQIWTQQNEILKKLSKILEVL
jgi:hypothetical protein